MDAVPDAIDILIRITDKARLDDLGRTVFSAALQDRQPARIIVLCQGFDAAATAALHRTLAPIMAIEPAATLLVLHDRPADRPGATLLSLGLAAMRGRYAAILDCGAVLYPEAHRLLIAELQASGAAIAEAGIVHATVDRDGLVPYVAAKTPIPANALPLHALLMHRSRIDPADLASAIDPPAGPAAVIAPPTLARLRACATVSTRLHDVIIGER